nr:hypothetical protein [Tanacetum cinerariifolium]
GNNEKDPRAQWFECVLLGTRVEAGGPRKKEEKRAFGFGGKHCALHSVSKDISDETREEESFDPIPRTPEDSEDDGNVKKDQGLRISMVSIFATASSSVAPLQTYSPIMTPSTIATITSISHAPIPPTTIPIEVLQNLPTFDSVFRFDERLKSLEASFSEYRQTNPFAKAVSNIPGIVHQYMNQMMNEAVRVAVQIQTDRLRDSYQRENDEFLRTINDNMKRIIKEQALVEAYEADKIILDTYGEHVILKRRCDDDDQGEQAGLLQGPNLDGRRQASLLLQRNMCRLPLRLKNPHIRCLKQQADSRSSFNELLDTPLDFSKFIMNRLRVDTLTLELLVGPTYELIKGSCNSLIELEYHLEEVYKATTDQFDWVNPEGQQYPDNLLQPLPLISDNRGRRVIPFAHFINNDLEYLRGGESINYDKHALWGVSHWGRKRQQFYGFAVNRESALDVYSKRRIIAITDLKIVKRHNYKHLDWITVRRDDDKLYKFKEGDFKRLRLQDIEDMLLLLVQGKLSNLTVKERFAFNVSLRIDGTLNDVRNALDDCLKGTRMQYLPQTIWRKGDKDRAAAMIQAIDKMLKTRRIMRSLERFIGGRLYE